MAGTHVLRIIVVGFHSEAWWPALLLSLERYLHVPAELVAWDNDGRTRVFLEQWLVGRKLRTPIVFAGDGRNLGFGASVNRAAKLNTGRSATHFLLLNADSELASPIDEAALTLLKAGGGIKGLRLFDDAAKTRRQASARAFPSWMTSIAGREGFLRRVWPENPWSRQYLGASLATDVETRVDWVSGCGLFCSRGDWERLGGFDERFFMYAEDVDLGRRAKSLQIPVHYAPFVDVVHAMRGSTGRRSLRADLYHHRSMWAYYWKWASPVARLFAPFVAMGIFLRFAVRRIA